MDVGEGAVGWGEEAGTARCIASGPVSISDIGSRHHVGAVGEKRLRRSCVVGEVNQAGLNSIDRQLSDVLTDRQAAQQKYGEYLLAHDAYYNLL